ncbi:MAG: hemerythrin family protein [Clostridiales bacterium]|nr:hemerythrin family protein [Clostridiales bacterium]
MYAEFDESLVTGNDMIDAQHKELIDKINKLVGCCEQSGGKLEAIKMLDYLADYTEFHFGAEEKLQEEISYPGIAEHKKQHADFKQAVAELHDMLEEEEGPTDAFVSAVNKNVIDWLYRHIKGFDCSVASYKNMKTEAERL